MSSFTLDHSNRLQITEFLHGNIWVVTCLCAAWCDTCRQYQNTFDVLALRHPDKHFLWIDIEDQADVIEDIDVENFPTLIIQYDNIISFFGTVLPDLQLTDRLIQAQTEKSLEELQIEATSSLERKKWQHLYNLRNRI